MEVYDFMRSPRETSFRELGRKIGLSWSAAGDRFERILQQCEVHISFFPCRLKGYEYLFLTFRTEYEIGVEEALKKLDRSSFLYKADGLIMLILFLLPEPLKNNRVVNRFRELEEIGIIHDLRVSIPIKWHNIL